MNYYSLAGCLLMVGLLAGCQSGEKKTLSDKGENVFPVSTHRALNPIAPPGVFIAESGSKANARRTCLYLWFA